MEISSNFFHCGQADPKAKTCSSAYLNYSSIHCDHRVEFELQVKKNCDSVILKFNLVKLTTEKNGITVSKNLEGVDPLWTDWIPNEFAWPIFSESLKKMIVDSLHPNQKVDWIKCEVSHNEEIRLYYIPIYRYHEEILDKKNTRYVENTNLIMLPVFNMDAINDLDFFILPFEYGIERMFYASNRLKRKLVKEKISGIDYEKNVYVASSDCLNNEKNNFDLPYSDFEKWLNEILSNENEMSDDIVAFCFNLYEDADDYWSVELVGSASFDKDDNDWPCDEVFTTRESPLTWKERMTWEDCLQVVESHLSNYLQNGKYSKILLSKQGVGYGFVDGDLFLM